jgi:GT2 family glycosyltransferase
MPIGMGIVLIGMGERTNHQAVGQIAHELFKQKAATRVIACVMPKSRAAMHLDTVFSFCDRDACTVFREVVDQIGLLDERFEIGCFEDYDFCLRALTAGWRAVIVRDAFVHHIGGTTFVGNDDSG